jgi:hypothetical protein
MQTDFEKEVLDLEMQFWTSMRDRDGDAASRLTDDTCVVTGAQGVAQIDKKTIAELMETEAWTLHDFTIRDVKIRRVSDDVAIIGYNVHEELTVDGKPLSLDAADASTWIRKDGRWVCALHTESLAGDPFGRDRFVAPGPRPQRR